MKTAMWKTLITRLQRYIAVWPDTLKTLVNDWLRSGNYSHQSLKVKDCMTTEIGIPSALHQLAGGIFFQYKMMVDDREGLHFSLSYHKE